MALVIGSPILYGIGQHLAPWGMMIFWIGFFLLLKPVVDFTNWWKALMGGITASILYALHMRYWP